MRHALFLVAAILVTVAGIGAAVVVTSGGSVRTADGGSQGNSLSVPFVFDAAPTTCGPNKNAGASVHAPQVCPTRLMPRQDLTIQSLL